LGPPFELLATDSVFVNFNITNNGSAASPVTTKAFWIEKATAPTCNDGGTVLPVAPLAPGESRTESLFQRLPGAPGLYTFRVMVDNTCTVNEVSETDNIASLPYLISATIGPIANLALTSLVLSPSPSSGAFTPGQLVNVTVGVLNNGTALINSAVAAFSDSPDAPPCREPGRAAVAASAALPGGSSANITFAVPVSLSFGAKTLRLVLDADCLEVESTRADNFASVSYNVAGPDFVVSNLQVIPLGGPVLQVGTIFSVNATITNVSGVADGVCARKPRISRAKPRVCAFVCAWE
jgi:hypothetical protein